MTDVVEFISQFATDTGHKQHLEPDTTLMIKKFLATQAPIVDDFKKVYPFVANDLNRIEFRAPNQLQRYNSGILLKKGQLDSICEKASVDPNSHYPVFNDFCKKIDPPKGSELAMFFLHSQRNKNLEDLVPSNVMFTRIRNYTVPEGIPESLIVSEIGHLIAGLTFTNPEWEYSEIDCGYNKESVNMEEEEEEEESDDEEDISFVISPEIPYTAEHEKELRNNPVMIAFKKDNKITHQYSAVKVAKQMLVSAVHPIGEHLNPLLGKRQKLNMLKSHPISDPILSIIDHMDVLTIEQILSTPQAQLYIRATTNDPSNVGRQTVKDLIMTHYLHDQPKYLKRTTEHLSTEICNLIIGSQICIE